MKRNSFTNALTSTRGMRNDPDIGIEWPIEDIGEENILLSEKDKLWKPLKDTDVDF